MDIWGINEELRVLIRLFDKNGLVLPNRKIEVLVNGKLTDVVTTDAVGSATLRYTYDAPGMYEVSCYFKGDEHEGACSASRMARIVDFRSEASGLYDAVVKAARRKGARTSKKLTPREVERVIVTAIKRIDQRTLDQFIGYAEEALYSSHDFTRKSYIDMLVIYKPIFAFIEEV